MTPKPRLLDEYWGTCRECGCDIRMRKFGTLWTHGPRNNRCVGSGSWPIYRSTPQIESAIGARDVS